MLCSSKGKLEPVAGSLSRCSEGRTGVGTLRLSLGKALVGLKDLAEAEAQVREALRLQPDNPDAHQVLATIYKAQNRFA